MFEFWFSAMIKMSIKACTCFFFLQMINIFMHILSLKMNACFKCLQQKYILWSVLVQSLKTISMVNFFHSLIGCQTWNHFFFYVYFHVSLSCKSPSSNIYFSSLILFNTIFTMWPYMYLLQCAINPNIISTLGFNKTYKI